MTVFLPLFSFISIYIILPNEGRLVTDAYKEKFGFKVKIVYAHLYNVAPISVITKDK